MRPEWRRYRKEFLHNLIYVPWGIAASLVPFFLSLGDWQRRGAVLTGLIVSLNYGVMISLAIFFLFGGVFAAIISIRVRTGLPLRVPKFLPFLVGSIGIVCGIWLARLVNARILGEPPASSPLGAAILFGLLTAIPFFLYFAYRQAREDALSLRATLAEARYNALEHQMRPHFLFNALNSLAELIESDHERAAETAYTLSDLYRQILASSSLKTAPLASELDIARRYMELEQLRFGSRLTFCIEASGDNREVYIPSLIVQTLVENAVKHGISKSIDGGHICVAISKTDGGSYHLLISNTGEPYREGASEGTGLANTRARLDLLYGDRHDFKINRDDDGKTVASFYFSGEKIV